MVQNALELAKTYRMMEVQTMEQIGFYGVPISAEAAADAKERLCYWRAWVCSFIVAAKREATEEEAKELSAALIVLNSSRF